MKQLRLHWKKVFGALALGLVLLMVAGWQLSRSRDYQLLGEIVPRVDIDKKLVALTFDDGPTPGFTEEILTTLKTHQVPATFFVTGKDLAKHPELGKKIVRAGHELGNHSFSHKRMVFTPYDKVRQELEATEDLIKQAGQNEPIFFRPPYTKKLFNLPLYLWLNQVVSITTDVEPDSYPEVAASADNIADYVAAEVQPGSIVLLHVMYPSRATSMAAVPGIIQKLRQQGYEFVTVRDLLAERQRA
ncbi:MAG: polysaccharide deacetylase family protein [Xanthomonadales bacterium]|jgi:chitin deacetylase|nr:polysaccharide deacetylase family protein [Xanthomonadales bacterium]